MADLFNDLGPVSFDGVQFPVTAVKIDGGQRKRVHSYPHTDGGKPEKLGRELYVVQADAIFDVSLHRQYPDLWPDGLRALVRKFESGTTGDLYLPTRGTLRCFADRWSQEMSAAVRSGERVAISFLEDDEDGFGADALTVLTPVDFAAQAATVEDLRKAYESEMTEADKSIFDKIDDAVNKARAAQGSVDLAQTAVAAKFSRLAALCDEAIDTVTAVQDPRAYPLLEALKELWAVASETANDVSRSDRLIDTYVTPLVMSVPQIAVAVYGSSDKQGDLLSLNLFRDPYAVPAGTVVRYYVSEDA